MKHYFLGALIALLLPLSVSGQAAFTAIRKVLDAQEAAWNKGDIEGFMQGYWKSDSLTFIGKSGLKYGWQNTLDGYKKGYPDAATMGKLTFRILRMEKINRNNVYVIGKWDLKRSVGDVGGHFTLIWRKVHGQWVVVSDHSS